MNIERSLGAILVAGLAVLCCAGPTLVAAVGAIALSASALAGAGVIGIVAIFVGFAGIWLHRRRASAGADCCTTENATRKSVR